MGKRRLTSAIGVLSITALAAACGGQPAEEMLPDEGAAPPAEPAPTPAEPMDTIPADTADTTGTGGI